MTSNRAPEPSVDPPDVTRSVTPSLEFPIVGVGASAGGIQALTRLFEHMPNEAGMANLFRDRDAFEALEREIVPRICEDKSDDDSIRVWAAGCSTGEEAYSVAMLLNECVAEANKGCAIQVFATDIDESAIETARTGNYPSPIVTDVPPARLRKFFTLTHGRYLINKSLR
ncbi:CheR family methyltransferase, partial [Caballeronia arationis]|uniref:CheR family methyltransferase n=1 Tax=Caballeronia arationis TaxID=1777142 RepID=UPI002E0E53DB